MTQLRVYRVLLICILAVLAMAGSTWAQSQTNPAQPMLRRIVELGESGKHTEALPLARALIEDQSYTFASVPPERAIAKLYLSSLYANAREFQNALDAARDAEIDLRQTAETTTEYGDIVLLLARALHFQAYALIGLKQFDAAAAEHEKSLRTLETWRSDKSIATRIQCLTELASLSRELDRQSDATGYSLQALALTKIAAAPQPRSVATLTNEVVLAMIYQGRAAQTTVLLDEAIALIGTNAELPEESEVAANLYHNRGIARKAKEDFQGAVDALKKSIEIRQKLSVKNAFDLSASHNMLGVLYTDLQKSQQAQQEFEYARAALENAPPGFNRQSALALLADHLAGLQMTNGEFEQAVATFETVVSKDLILIAPVHQRGMILMNYGTALAKTNRADAAEKALRKGLSEIENHYGKTGSYYETALNNLATFLIDRGRHIAAEPIVRELVDRRLASGSPEVGVDLSNLGLILKRQGRLAEARALYERAIDVEEKNGGGADHAPRLSSRLVNLGVVLELSDDLDGAERAYLRALGLTRDRSGGAQTAEQYRPLASLAALERQRGSPDRAAQYFAEAEAIKSRFVIPDALAGGRPVAVMYATDRALTDTPGRARTHGADRIHKVNFGTAIVTVPEVHKIANVETAPGKQTKEVLFQDIGLHLTINSATLIDEEQFVAAIERNLTAGSRFNNEALVYIHGFNVSFDNALMRMGQIVSDTGFDGAALLYSWASNGKIQSYRDDEARALASADRLADVLRVMTQRTKVAKIHIIAHSMGNQALVEMIRKLPSTERSGFRIGQLMLAAPDVDARELERNAAAILQFAASVTLYATSNDRALVASRLVHPDTAFRARAGDIPFGNPLIVPGIETIDVSTMRTDGLNWNHSFYADTEGLLTDMGTLMKSDTHPPDRRNFERVVHSNGGVFWRWKRQ